jgi:redox-sensitive bicupin YhaK (pirin superfamily)
MLSPTERPLADVTRSLRLPVWPVVAGVAGWLCEAVGLGGLEAALERRFGGRVQPMQLPLGASDPFLMLVHHVHTFSPWDPLRWLSALVLPEGFPAHPHRGFETVTFVLEGGMRHRDSAGVKMVYRSGSVQWLTAGRGVMHEEMWEPGVRRQELYQLWVNLPRDHKGDPPQIQLLGPAEVETPGIPHHPLPVEEIDSVRLSVLAGTCRGVTSPVRTRSPLGLIRVEWTAPGDFVWDDVPTTHTVLCFVRSGAVSIGGRLVRRGELATFARGSPLQTRIRLTAFEASTDVLLLTGAPLHEPVAMGGAMVMNTAAEVEAAHEDLRRGRFGPSWPPSVADDEWRAILRGDGRR